MTDVSWTKKMIERYKSPDGQLELFVSCDDGDWTVHFGHDWHTHGDVLAAEYQLRGIAELEPREAVRRFVADVKECRAVIAIEEGAGERLAVWVTDSPAESLKYKPKDRTIDFRYWDGSSWSARGSV